MGYCTYITRDGYELQAKLFAEGGNFNITKVEVGAGVCPADVDPSTLTALVEFKATATSTKPHRAGCEVSLTVEYRSDLDGGLKKPFQINEFGVFATGVDGDEILLLYGDLSDYPESAVPQEYGGCVRRYPINVTIGPEANATLSYPAGAWMTHEEAEDLINAALNKGLDMGDGTTVPEAVENIKNELDQTKEDLKNDLDSAKADMQDDLNSLKQAVDGSSWYRAFEPEEWTGNQIRLFWMSSQSTLLAILLPDEPPEDPILTSAGPITRISPEKGPALSSTRSEVAISQYTRLPTVPQVGVR